MGFCLQMKLEEFAYDLPEGLIAQEPAAVRDRSRMMVVHLLEDQPSQGGVELFRRSARAFGKIGGNLMDGRIGMIIRIFR